MSNHSIFTCFWQITALKHSICIMLTCKALQNLSYFLKNCPPKIELVNAAFSSGEFCWQLEPTETTLNGARHCRNELSCPKPQEKLLIYSHLVMECLTLYFLFNLWYLGKILGALYIQISASWTRRPLFPSCKYFASGECHAKCWWWWWWWWCRWWYE